MSRVEIEAGGRRVVVDHDAELEHLVRHARELWDHTATVPDEPGPAYGFSSDRRWSAETRPTNGGGGYTHRPFTPVTAEAGTDG